jgi:hypothetical protein
MGWLSLLICALPLYLLYNAGHPVLWVLALINAITNVWTFGVMHNYAVKSSAHRIKGLRQNLAVEGKLSVEKQQEIDRLKLIENVNAIPTWLSTVNMIFLSPASCL